MSELDIRYARSGDLNIAYLAEGRGEIDMLHLGAYISRLGYAHAVPSFEPYRRRLQAVGRVIQLDGRGMGASDRMIGAQLPTLEDRVDDVLAVLDDARAERVLVCSFADSGPVGCLLAATHPERTLGLVLLNTRPRISWAHDYPWGVRPDAAEREIREIRERWGSISLARENAEDEAFGMTLDEATSWQLNWMRDSAGRGDTARLLEMHMQWDVRHVLGTIRVPTLVLTRGGTMAEEGAAFAALIPGARHQVMPGTSRIVYGDHTDAYLDAVADFAAEIREAEAELESTLATVLFTDIVDSTARQATVGDHAWQRLVERHHDAVRGCLARFRGRELDTAGDGFFATFDGPVRGIRCAQAIVEAVRPLGLEVRTGLHTGECRPIDGKIGGLAVSIGARVCALALPGEVLVSQTVRDLVAGAALELKDRGEHELKGVPGTWRVYAVG